MTKFRMLGAVALFCVLAGPAMARHASVHLNPYVNSGRCGYHQLGNPYTPQQDYMAWSAWRARGGWAEPSFDPACSRVSRSYRHWHGY